MNTKSILIIWNQNGSFFGVVFAQICEENMRNLLFGDYMTPDVDESERLYAEVPSMERFSEVVESYLEEYNQTHKNHMNLVIFR